MKVKRIVHSILCFVLCCCILLHSMPVKADATAAGAAAVITGAAGVSVAAPLAIGASLIALGIMAKNTNPLVFENTVNDAVASLSAAGTWVKDGAVELLQTIDESGQKAYYVAGDMLEDLRSWLFDSSYIWYPSTYHDTSNEFSFESNSYTTEYPCYSFSWVYYSAPYYYSSTWLMSAPGSNLIVYLNGESVQGTSYKPSGLDYYCVLEGNKVKSTVRPAGHYIGERGVDFTENLTWAVIRAFDSIYGNNSLATHYDLSLGYLPTSDTVLTDDVIVTINPYDVKTIRTKYGGSGGSGNNGNNMNWWVGVGLSASLAALATKTQQQVIEDPQVEEIPDLNTGIDFRIEYETEVEINPDTGEESKKDIIVLNPVEVPGAGDSGNGSDGDGDGDDVIVPPDSDSTWFQKIIQGIEELPNKFQSWITDCKTAIEELPNKFATWLDSIIEWLRKIWESLQTLASNIVNGLKQILIDLFAPSPDFISGKVNSLTTKYPYMDTFLGLGSDLKSFFLGLGTKPPIIYINLGAATGSYDFGGVQPFIDLSWYAAYKPTMDAVLGAFLWLWLAWRVFLMLPGLINGASGAAGSVIRYQERSVKSNDGGANK